MLTVCLYIPNKFYVLTNGQNSSCYTRISSGVNVIFFIEGPRSRCYRHTAALSLIVQPCNEDDEVFFLVFYFNGTPVEWYRQGKTEVLRGKPVPVPLCPPQIPHEPTRDRTRAYAVKGRGLTAWVMARLNLLLKNGFTSGLGVIWGTIPAFA
jgi:hypothetical protein